MSNVERFTLDSDALSDYLETAMPGFRGPVSAVKFPNGQSNPTYLLDSGSDRYVLRRKPPGELLKSAHAVEREYKVMSALSSTKVPVAATHHLCEDCSVIGSAFYIMEYVTGRVLWNPGLPEIAHAQRKAYYRSMVQTLANLHSVNVADVGLNDFGKHGNYLQRQISLWTRQYRGSQTQELADMEYLIEALPERCPADDDRTTLVHGDFRLDNMMFHPQSSEVLAVMDWELSTLGHPFTDLAYQCMQLRMPNNGLMSGLGGIDRAPSGIPEEQEYLQWYCDIMNLTRIEHWEFFLALSFFRFAAILQGVKKRALEGNASSDEALQMGEFVQPLAAMGREQLQ